jgi:acyl carrier protein
MADLLREIKELIINSLNLEGTTPDQIEDDAPLFGSGLGLDSIDALELAVAVERTYKVTIPDEAVGKQVFSSAKTLAAYIGEHRAA